MSENTTNSEKEKEIFEAIYSDIRKCRADGCIVKIFEPEDRPRVVKTEDLCNQPTEGLLYDLDIDEAVLATIYKDRPLQFANEMAVATVLSFLHKFYLENKDKKQ